LLLFGFAGIARADGVRVVTDVSYLGSGSSLKLDLYLPARDPKVPLHPALVWIHGNKQNKATGRARDFCGILAAAGYVCASVDYGPQGDRLGNILDCKNAVRFLRAHAAAYQVDPARVAVVGGSAGGYLALMVGLTRGKAKFEPAQPYPGVSSAVGAVIDFYGVVLNQPDSPLDQIDAGSPPILILHGTGDNTVSYTQSVRLDAVLTAKGVPHRLILLQDLPHGFNLAPSATNPLPMDLRPVVLDFLNQSLRPAP
jgi:acetyl esterase/lipase